MIQLEEDVRVPKEVAEFNPELAKGKFRVVALGDSITECANMKREEGWAGILEQLLGPDTLVVNAGIGGTSSSLGLYRWRRDVVPMNPRCVVICFLLNDSHIRHYECSSSYLVQCTPHQMEGNMRAMFDLTRAMGAEPILWTPPLVPTWGSKDLRLGIQMQLLELYQSFLERVAAQRGVRLVNFWRTFPSLVEEYPGRYFNQPDGYHSTVQAQPVLARGIRDALADCLAAWKSGGRPRAAGRPRRGAWAA